MSQKLKGKVGAHVLYCGHQGWFVADIYVVGGAAVVVANGKITSDNINRKELDTITHHLSDFPTGGCWNPNRGFFVVPADQVSVIDDSNRSKYLKG